MKRRSLEISSTLIEQKVDAIAVRPDIYPNDEQTNFRNARLMDSLFVAVLVLHFIDRFFRQSSGINIKDKGQRRSLTIDKEMFDCSWVIFIGWRKSSFPVTFDGK